MSRLREQFKKIPPPRNNNFSGGGTVLDWLSNAGDFIKKGLKTVTDIARDIIDATGGDKGLIGSMLKDLVSSGASDEDVNGVLNALVQQLSGKTDGGIDFSSVPELPELEGFAGSSSFAGVKPQDVGPVFKNRFAGEHLVGGANTDMAKLAASANTIFNPKQYMDYRYEGPKGTNIKIGK
tara:strand:+ start:227 stop:766 length:540 start_codon:yes stop_codon:yes gene_type:complete